MPQRDCLVSAVPCAHDLAQAYRRKLCIGVPLSILIYVYVLQHAVQKDSTVCLFISIRGWDPSFQGSSMLGSDARVPMQFMIQAIRVHGANAGAGTGMISCVAMLFPCFSLSSCSSTGLFIIHIDTETRCLHPWKPREDSWDRAATTPFSPQFELFLDHRYIRHSMPL